MDTAYVCLGLLALSLGSLGPLAGCNRADAGATPDARTPPTAMSPSSPKAPSSPNIPAATARRAHVGTDPGHAGDGTALTPGAGHELAAFAAGCFWGVEDNFRQVPGVVATAVGYSGGHTDHPTYPVVCEHETGHAETVLVEFDPKVVTYAVLVNVFFKNHDPTTVNRQGPDVGDQYRSAIFTFSPDQVAVANAAKERTQTAVGKRVATIVEPVAKFWKAEEYHQQYDEKTGTHSCPTPRGLTEGT